LILIGHEVFIPNFRKFYFYEYYFLFKKDMKFSFPALHSLFFAILIFCFNSAYNQQLSDEVNSKLSESDQKKINKADNLAIKGELQLSKAGYPGDKQLLEMLNMGETKELKKYAGERLDVANLIKESNLGRFSVYEKNCSDFWKKYLGDKRPLEVVNQSQINALKKYEDAQKVRKDAEKIAKTAEKLPLLIDAENKEKESISLLQKVLFVYQNYPVTYDQSWFPTETEKNTQTEPAKSQQNIVKTEVTPTVTSPIIPVVAEKKNQTEAIPIATKDSVKKNIPDTAGIKKAIPQKQNTVKKDKATGDSSLYTMANINEDQIDQFNTFLQKKYPNKYENYIIDFQSIDYSDLQSLRDAWYRYKYGVASYDSLFYLAEQPKNIDSTVNDSIHRVIAQDLTKDSVKTTSARKDIKGKTKETAQNKSKSKEKLTKPEIAAIEKEIKAKTQGTHMTENAHVVITSPEENLSETAKGFLFKVQIAASRVQLNENVLNSIYKGNEKISETFEDNWYKYTIGTFDTYKQARQLRDNTSVKGVFVVAYLNGKRIKITPAVVSKKYITESENQEGIQAEKIEFRLQLIASKIVLDASVLKNIYNGPIAIDTFEEDGLLKYSILAGNKLSDAIELLKTINVPGSFVVAYYNHQRLNLRTAIKLTKNN
jgi:hypothetical protein